MDKRKMNRIYPSMEELRSTLKVLHWLFEKNREEINMQDSPLRMRVLSNRISNITWVNGAILNEISERRKIKNAIY